MNNTFKTLLNLIKVLNFQKKTIIFLALSIVASFFEILGVGIFIPIITSILDIDKIIFFLEENKIFLKPTLKEYILELIIIVSLFISILRFIVLNYHSYYSSKFIQEFTSKSNIKLFKRYINEPYEYFLKVNTSEFIRNLQTELNYFSNYTYAILFLFVEILSIFFLGTFIFIYNPYVTITISLFVLLNIKIFDVISNKKIKKWSNERQTLDGKISKILIESFNTIKDIKINNSEKFHTNSYRNLINGRTKKLTLLSYFTILPKYFLEFISVITLILIIYFSLISGVDSDKLLILFSLIGITFLKVFPSISRCITYNQQLKSYLPSFNLIEAEVLKSLKIKKGTIFKGKIKNLELKKVCFRYGNKLIFENVSIKIKTGDFIGIYGKSGEGKSTLLDIISGLLLINKGSSFVNGELINGKLNFANQVGYSQQKTVMIDDSIVNNICLQEDFEKINHKKFKEVCIQAELYQFIDSLPKQENSFLGEKGVNFSGGQLQRIGLARALYKSPQILLLDEATTGLDKQTEKSIINNLKKSSKNRITIIVSHDLDLLKNCSSLYSLSSGIFNEIE